MLGQVLLGTVFSNQLRKISNPICRDELPWGVCYLQAFKWACLNWPKYGGVRGSCDLTCFQRGFFHDCTQGELSTTVETTTLETTTVSSIEETTTSSTATATSGIPKRLKRLGGWTEYNPSIWTSVTQPYELDMMNFGMMTCVQDDVVHSNKCSDPWSWSPSEYDLPADNYGREKYLTIGGADCDAGLIDADYIIEETRLGGWHGIDVDVACKKMDIYEITKLIKRSNEVGLKTSITFEGNETINYLKLVKLLESDVENKPNQYNITWFDDIVWTDATKHYYFSIMKAFIFTIGGEELRVYPAINTRVVNDENLGMLLDIFNEISDLGGLMIWEPSFVVAENAFGMTESQWQRIRDCIYDELCN